MGASAYIGRVGGLAVALGIGAAVAMGHGVAWAGPTESDPSTTDPPPSADADAGLDPAAAPDAPDANTPPISPTPEAARETQTPSLTTLTSRANSVLSSLTRAAERGIAVTTGGALTSKKVTSQKNAGAAAVDEAEPEETDVVEPADSEPVEKKSSAAPANKPIESLVRRLPHLPAAKPTVDARSVDGLAARVVAADPNDTTVQRTAGAAEQTTFQTQSDITTVQDDVPVMMAAADAPIEQPALPRLLTNLVSAFGLGGLASDTPGTPIGTPIAMALLALGVRRESEESVSALTKTTAVGNSPVAALALTGAQTAAVTAASDPGTSYSVNPVAVSPNTSIITKVTGPGGLNDTPARFGVGGTDLGIMWDNGIPDNPSTTTVNEHQVLILFGDTFGSNTPVRTGVWRNNMLLRSSDNILSNGMYVRDGSVPIEGTTADDFTGAPLVYNSELNQNIFKQVIANERYAVGQDITIIPTSAISVPYNNAYGSRQYATFMDVRSWDTPGRWTTNYSGVAYLRRQRRDMACRVGEHPRIRPGVLDQAVRLRQPELPAGSTRQAAGGLSGCGCGLGLRVRHSLGARGHGLPVPVKQDQILDQTKYEYWNGTAWVANKPSAATPVLPGTTTSSFFGLIKRTTYPTVGEMSVQYNEYEQKYIMIYADQSNNIVMRKADRPEGPWSAPTTLVTSSKMPGLYAPMIHPWSSTTNVPESDRQYLYWNLSTWNDYQVTMMRTDLSKV